jgi:hypothetical protein
MILMKAIVQDFYSGRKAVSKAIPSLFNPSDSKHIVFVKSFPILLNFRERTEDYTSFTGIEC